MTRNRPGKRALIPPNRAIPALHGVWLQTRAGVKTHKITAFTDEEWGCACSIWTETLSIRSAKFNFTAWEPDRNPGSLSAPDTC